MTRLEGRKEGQGLGITVGVPDALRQSGLSFEQREPGVYVNCPQSAHAVKSALTVSCSP